MNVTSHPVPPHLSPKAAALCCAECCSPKFLVTTISTIVTRAVTYLKCRRCAHRSIAAIHRTVARDRRRYVGRLNADLRVTHGRESDRTEKFEQNDLSMSCAKCVAASHDGDWWELLRHEVAEDPIFPVDCGDCDHRINFGWSDGPRFGRVVPIESTASVYGAVSPDPMVQGGAA